MRQVQICCVMMFAALILWGCQKKEKSSFNLPETIDLTEEEFEKLLLVHNACGGSSRFTWDYNNVLNMTTPTNVTVAELGNLQEVVQCLLDATNCMDRMRCYYDVVDTGCDDDSLGSQCDGDDILSCREAGGVTYLTRNQCSGSCAQVNPDEWTVITFCYDDMCSDVVGDDSHCDGNVLESCSDGYLRRLDCAEMGMNCDQVEYDGGSFATCVDPSSRCNGRQNYCEGNVLYWCESLPSMFDVVYSRTDCSQMFDGAVCMPRTEAVDSDWFDSPDTDACACVQEGTKIAEVTESCEGSRVKLCQGESCRTFDCAKFLNGTCEEDIQPGEPTAVHCVPGI